MLVNTAEKRMKTCRIHNLLARAKKEHLLRLEFLVVGTRSVEHMSTDTVMMVDVSGNREPKTWFPIILCVQHELNRHMASHISVLEIYLHDADPHNRVNNLQLSVPGASVEHTAA
jgi:hypothetical protein